MPHPGWGFSLACLLGMILIICCAGIEIARFRRGESIVTRSQLRLRLVSAGVWLAVLAVNHYAVVDLWPTGGKTPEGRQQAKHFLQVMGVGFSLLLLAIILVLIDLKMIARERRSHENRFKAEFAELAGTEVDRLKSR